MTTTSGLAPDAQLGRYRLLGLLGRGGMGEVWVAHDPDLDRKVALKVLRSASTSADARARLLREGRAMARLRHPNVVTVFEAASVGGRDLVAMELVDGQNMATWLGESRTMREIVETLLAAGRGLAAAHRAGMVHRDFKPHNVLVEREGRVLVTDFGLARALEMGAWVSDGGDVGSESARLPKSVERVPVAAGDVASADTLAVAPAKPVPDETAAMPHRPPSSVPAGSTSVDRAALHTPLTMTGALLGTPAYMAPEQLLGNADARTDQFAWCVTAWEALAGERPFHGSSIGDLQMSIAAGPSTKKPIPQRLRAILVRGLSPDPNDRWPDLEALLRVFEAAWKRPRRIAIGAGAATGVVAIAVAMIAMRGSTEKARACPLADEAIARADNGENQIYLARLRASGPLGVRAADFLAHWLVAWRDAYKATCDAETDPLFAARRACLEALVDDASAKLAIAPRVPIDAYLATDPASEFASPRLCVDHPRAIYAPLPADPVRRARIHRIWGDAMLFAAGEKAVDSTEARARAKGLLGEARATGDHALLAQILVQTATALGAKYRLDAQVCKDFEDAHDLAEEVGAERTRVVALLAQIGCTFELRERRGERASLLKRTSSLVDGLGDPLLRAALDRARALDAMENGGWDDAITLTTSAREAFVAAEAPTSSARAAVDEATARMWRHEPGDLATAERIVRAAMPVVAASPELTRSLRGVLAAILFQTGKLDESHAILDDRSGTQVGVVTRSVIVVENGAPVRDVEIVAAREPFGDPTRIAWSDKAMGVAHTAADGIAYVGIGDATIVVAHKGDRIGAVAGIKEGTKIELVPSLALEGNVDLPPRSSTDPRVARFAVPAILVTTTIGGIPWRLMAPVDEHGRWKFPALPPGAYSIDLEVLSALGTRHAAMVTRELTAPLSVDLAIPPLQRLRVISRPAFTGFIVAVPGELARPLDAWADVLALVAKSRTISLVAAASPELRASTDNTDHIDVGDSVTLIGVPDRGPITVCALPGASAPFSAFAIGPGPDTAKPHCAAVTMPVETMTLQR